MPDGMNTSYGSQQMVQRGRGGGPRGGFPGGGPRGGFPGGGPRGGFPGGGPRGGFPGRRFPRPFPMRQRFPRFFFFPVNFGFPTGRCFWIDEFGRCCDRFGRCCDRFGRCSYGGFYDGFASSQSEMDGWYGIPGGWDTMPDYDDMADYDMDMDDMEDV